MGTIREATVGSFRSRYQAAVSVVTVDTGIYRCGKLTSFLVWVYSYKKGSYLAAPCIFNSEISIVT
jgi:hypothetical protein